MGTEQQGDTTRIRKSSRPFTGFLLGLILGVALAIVLQQAGVWPLDRLFLFGVAGVFALIGILLGSMGRDRVGAFASTLPVILAVGLLAFAATGLTEINENGQLNGGCTVDSTSSVDSTVVTDTSKRDPFDIDPEGSLSWVARSPGPIMDHVWEIHVDVGGFSVPVAGNDVPDPNSDGDQENTGDVADVSSYVQEVSDFTGLELRGVFEVGGEIEGEGGACDGFAFVRLTADPLTTLVSQIAAGVGLLALIGLLFLAFSRTREIEVDIEAGEAEDEMVGAGGTAGVAGAIDTEGDDGGPGRGAHVRPEDDDGNGPVDSGGAGPIGDEENERHQRDDM
ncbi:MAG TPA: hypothetical protein VIH55_07585 [Acidimicrobiia bacterium]